MRIIVDEMPTSPYKCIWCKDESCMDYEKYTCTFKNSEHQCWDTSECPYFVKFKDMFENEFCEAGHILYNNIDNIEWKHLPKPITECYDEVMRYCYLGNGLYFFKYTDINVTWSDYFMAKGNSPWDALKNYFRWSDERYKSLRSEMKPLTR